MLIHSIEVLKYKKLVKARPEETRLVQHQSADKPQFCQVNFYFTKNIIHVNIFKLTLLRLHRNFARFFLTTTILYSITRQFVFFDIKHRIITIKFVKWNIK